MPKDYPPGNEYGHVCPVCGDELQEVHNAPGGSRVSFVCRNAIGEQVYEAELPEGMRTYYPAGALHKELVYYRPGDRRIYARLRP